MVYNSETKVFGVPNTKEANSRSASKVQKFYGLGFPIGWNTAGGYFSKMSGLELIKRNITQLIRTTRGERFMLPLFGTNLKRYLFEPKDQFLFSKIKKEIAETIQRYAPYVELVKVEVTSTSANQYTSGLDIKLYCKVRDEDDVFIEVNLGII